MFESVRESGTTTDVDGLEIPAIIAGLLILMVVLWDTFETMVLPRNSGIGIRLTRFYYLTAWGLCATIARRMRPDNPFRQALLGAFGPLSLVLLITVWASLLILGFALLVWGIGHPLASQIGMKGGGFADYMYLSGVTLFTLGYGDKAPNSGLTKGICVFEAGVGFAMLATVIGFLPALYQTFARRESTLIRFYNRAGTPPSAEYILERHAQANAWQSLETLLSEWEGWGAELMESYRSYPLLAFYRSQKESQSWLAATVTILELCSCVERSGTENGALRLQAEATFNLLNGALCDLALVLGVVPQSEEETVTEDTTTSGPEYRCDPVSYERTAQALSERLVLPLPSRP